MNKKALHKPFIKFLVRLYFTSMLNKLYMYKHMYTHHIYISYAILAINYTI